MANQEQKLALWRDLGKDFGTPPKDSDEYYKKMEVYYQILEDINQPPPPPPQRMPVRMPVEVRREEPELDSRQRGECCCDCHRRGDRAPVPVRRRIVRCDTSESDGEFGDVRLANRGRRVILTSDDESDSDSDDEPVRKKKPKPVGRPPKKSTAVQKVKKVEKEEKKKKSTASPPKKKTHTKVSRA